MLNELLVTISSQITLTVCITIVAFILGFRLIGSSEFREWWRRKFGTSLRPKGFKLHETPQTVSRWLTGLEPFVLDANEQDLDVILECSFSIEELITLYNTPNAIMKRRHWIASALWRSLDSYIENDPNYVDGRLGPIEANRLISFIATHLEDFHAFGFGTEPDCRILKYIVAKQIGASSKTNIQ